MPHRRLPNSIPAVLRVLKTARDRYKNTPVVTDRAISAALFAQLDDANPASLLSRLIKEANDVDLGQAAQAPLTSSLSQAAAQLTMFCSHFHQVLDLGIARGTFLPGARSYYGRDIGATELPDLSTYDAVKEAADKIVSGEEDRLTAEGATTPAMALPSAAEVQTVRDTFVAMRNASQAALANTNTQQEEAMALYPEAQALAVEICDTVEFFYRKDPVPSSRREKSARWGVVYLYDPGEEEPPPTPPPGP